MTKDEIIEMNGKTQEEKQAKLEEVMNWFKTKYVEDGGDVSCDPLALISFLTNKIYIWTEDMQEVYLNGDNACDDTKLFDPTVFLIELLEDEKCYNHDYI